MANRVTYETLSAVDHSAQLYKAVVTSAIGTTIEYMISDRHRSSADRRAAESKLGGRRPRCFCCYGRVSSAACRFGAAEILGFAGQGERKNSDRPADIALL
jgi:hypothetical protein